MLSCSFPIQRGMLAQLAARLRARQGGGDIGLGGGGVVVGEDGETVLIDDNCTVSSFWYSPVFTKDTDNGQVM